MIEVQSSTIRLENVFSYECVYKLQFCMCVIKTYILIKIRGSTKQ